MGRIANAVLALAGRLPAEEIEVVEEVGAEDLMVYRVDSEIYALLYASRDSEWRKAHGTIWPTCEAAFAAIGGLPNLHVEPIEAVRVGSRYFAKGGELKVSKPRKAKRRPMASWT